MKLERKVTSGTDRLLLLLKLIEITKISKKGWFNLGEINENESIKNDRKEVVEYDEKSIPLNVVSFLFPGIGLILYLYFGWNNRYPIKSSSIGKSAFAGLCFELFIFMFRLYLIR